MTEVVVCIYLIRLCLVRGYKGWDGSVLVFFVGTVPVFWLVVGIGYPCFLFGSRNQEGYGMETIMYP